MSNDRVSEKSQKGSPRSILVMVPNMITTMALCCGLTAIRFSFETKYEKAIIFIFIAMILDCFDGAIARAVGATSKLGAKLDSISDFVSFGVAPSMMLYFWVMKGVGPFGWVIVLVFAVCNALRLSRFKSIQATLPPEASHYFVGVPTPAAGALLMMPLMLTFIYPTYPDKIPFFSFFIGLWATMIAALMISKLPTFSVRSIKLPKNTPLFILVGVALITGGLINATWETLLILCSIYLISLMVSLQRYKSTIRHLKDEDIFETE